MQSDCIGMCIRIIIISANYMSVTVNNNIASSVRILSTAMGTSLIIGIIDNFNCTCDTVAASNIDIFIR